MFARLATSLLLLCVGRLADLEHFSVVAKNWATAFALVESFAGDDAVDFCVECQQAALVWLSREASGKSADG